MAAEAAEKHMNRKAMGIFSAFSRKVHRMLMMLAYLVCYNKGGQVRTRRTLTDKEKMGVFSVKPTMIKISEFAGRFGISDRHARRLFADTESDIVGHFEKRGAAGTFLDDYAVQLLRSKLRNPVEILPVDEFENVDKLKAEISYLEQQLNERNEQLAKLAVLVADTSATPALLAAANSERQALQIKTEEQAERIGSLEAEKDALSREKEKLSATLDETSNKLKVASEDVDKLQKDKKSLEDDKHLLEQTVARMKKATLWRRIRGWKE